MQRWYWFQTPEKKYIGKCLTTEAEIKQTFNCLIEGCLVTVFAIRKKGGVCGRRKRQPQHSVSELHTRGLSNTDPCRKGTAMENNVPNLDGMTQEEVSQWWTDHERMTPALAATIFPSKPKGYVRTARAVVKYAANKAVAMRLRIEGNIQRALEYEAICDCLYAALPPYARW